MPPSGFGSPALARSKKRCLACEGATLYPLGGGGRCARRIKSRKTTYCQPWEICQTAKKYTGADTRGTGSFIRDIARIERGERFPSALVLRRIAGSLGLNEEEVFAFAVFLSPQSAAEAETQTGRIDPYVAGMLASETMATQRSLIGLLYIFKSIVKE